MMNRIRKMTVLGILVAGLVFPTGAQAYGLLAAGSFIDVGLTVRTGNTIKGSGSFTNRGDLRKVCVGIRSERRLSAWKTEVVQQSEECRDVSNSSGFAFSAPDVKVGALPARHRLLHGGLRLEEMAIRAEPEEAVKSHLLSSEFLGRSGDMEEADVGSPQDATHSPALSARVWCSTVPEVIGSKRFQMERVNQHPSRG